MSRKKVKKKGDRQIIVQQHKQDRQILRGLFDSAILMGRNRFGHRSIDIAEYRIYACVALIVRQIVEKLLISGRNPVLARSFSEFS